MKGNIMTLADKLEIATDDEILEANKEMRKRFVKKLALNTVITIVAHFAAGFVIAAIEKKTNPEVTE